MNKGQVEKYYVIKVGKLYLATTSMVNNITFTPNLIGAFHFAEESFKDGYISDRLARLVNYGLQEAVAVEVTIETTVETKEQIILSAKETK